jgi:hypothetical protein
MAGACLYGNGDLVCGILHHGQAPSIDPSSMQYRPLGRQRWIDRNRTQPWADLQHLDW